MNIVIQNLELVNFKCFRHQAFTFYADTTTIRGRNGVGKTTIADAVLWCLFGKNSAGQSDFDIKTHDENGKPIPHLDHSVKMVLNIDGREVTLQRTLKETWVKKRGSDEQVFKNNTTEYMINGEVTTAADYKKYISELVSEDIFRAITNPSYFPSLKWQQQRVFLTSIASDIRGEEICGDSEALLLFQRQLSDTGEDIIAYRKHLSYQMKGIKDKLDKIPVRLEEQNKALPELLDWDAIEQQLSEASIRCKDIDAKVTAIEKGNGSDIKRAELRKKIEDLRKQLNAIEDEASEAIRKATNEHSQNLSELTIKFNQELKNQKLFEQAIEADKRLIERCKQTVCECDDELERLRLAWPNRKFSIDSSKGFCPTCGQPLPEEQWIEKQKEMRENFNKALEEEKQALRMKAAKIKENKQDAEKELEGLNGKLKADMEGLAVTKETINTIFSDKAKEEKKQLLTFNDFLPCNEEYQAALREKEILEEELNNITDSDDNKEQLSALEEQREECLRNLLHCQEQLAAKQQYEKILSLIDGINAEQKDLIRQLSELEKKEDVARQYQDRQNEVLESRINQHFNLVQWRLFRTVNNGGDPFCEPYCECYVNGVAYHDGLNQAARLNAGLDIINALCKFYNISAPIVLDNTESTLNIIKTTGQQIRLQVFDSDLSLV